VSELPKKAVLVAAFTFPAEMAGNLPAPEGSELGWTGLVDEELFIKSPHFSKEIGEMIGLAFHRAYAAREKTK
jgi:hypothetical protein